MRARLKVGFWLTVMPVCGDAATEEADGVGEKRALNEAGSDEREGDGDVA